MRHFLIIALSLLTLSCSHEDSTTRHGFGDKENNGSNNDGPNNGNNGDDNSGNNEENPTDITDEMIFADNSPRAYCKDFDIRFGDPGVLYTLSSEKITASLINITTGEMADFVTDQRNLKYQGKLIAQNLHSIKSDNDNGIYWYKGVHIEDGSAVYFVVEDLYINKIDEQNIIAQKTGHDQISNSRNMEKRSRLPITSQKHRNLLKENSN